MASKTTQTYAASIDGGQGGTTEIDACNLDEATGLAAIWARAGEWREDGTVGVHVSGPDGEETFGVDVKQSDVFADYPPLGN